MLSTANSSSFLEKDIATIVVPVFRNSASLLMLTKQIDNVMAINNFNYEIIFIDDASDDDSWQTIKSITKTCTNIRGFRLAKNRGQHVAVLFGLSRAQSPFSIVMDADLQDPPEAFTALLKACQESRADVIFAGRIGSYQSWPRMFTSRVYRSLLLERLIGLPGGAGMFFLITRFAIARLLKLSLPENPMCIGLIAAAKLVCVSIPVQRSKRAYGQSTYTSLGRIKSAIRMVSCALFTKPTYTNEQINLLDDVEIVECINSGNILESC